MKKWLVYIILMTWVFAQMDWKPIHYAWWHYGKYPEYAQNWEHWAGIRTWAARVLCPPCGALAENYYYVLMEIEAGEAEQKDVMPAGYSHNPINPHGDWSFYWGQGEGQKFRKVSMLSFYLYWLPNTLIWWLAIEQGGKMLKIFGKWAFCKACQAMRRFKKDHDKIWYCTKCGADL